MDQNQFVEKIVQHVRLASVQAMKINLNKPAGRKPDKRLVEMSRFYHDLDDLGRQKLISVIEDSIDEAIFGMLCIFDGARNIGSNGDLLIVYEDGSERIILNRGDYDLHDIYNDILSEN